MPKEILFKENFNDHFNREMALLLGYVRACDDGLVTEEEKKKLAKFMMEHPHTKYTLMTLTKDTDHKRL